MHTYNTAMIKRLCSCPYCFPQNWISRYIF